jgi:hypothetical protein
MQAQLLCGLACLSIIQQAYNCPLPTAYCLFVEKAWDLLYLMHEFLETNATILVQCKRDYQGTFLHDIQYMLLPSLN